MEKILKLLKQSLITKRNFASAIFIYLLFKWLYKCKNNLIDIQKVKIVELTIEKMNKNLNKAIPIKELAKNAGMCEALFRKVFKKVTGYSPKQFYDNLRLAYGVELLKQGFNVSEVSDKLGYSSPFHFSKIFCKKFGIPPSKI